MGVCYNTCIIISNDVASFIPIEVGQSRRLWSRLKVVVFGWFAAFAYSWPPELHLTSEGDTVMLHSESSIRSLSWSIHIHVHVWKQQNDYQEPWHSTCPPMPLLLNQVSAESSPTGFQLLCSVVNGYSGNGFTLRSISKVGIQIPVENVFLRQKYFEFAYNICKLTKDSLQFLVTVCVNELALSCFFPTMHTTVTVLKVKENLEQSKHLNFENLYTTFLQLVSSSLP